MQNEETKKVIELPTVPQGKNLHQRILAVMSDLSYIQKGDKTVNGQYRFVSHDQVTAALHPLLVKHGIVVIPHVEEMTQDGDRTMVKLSVVFRNSDSPADSFFITFYGYGIDKGDKGPGKAISYAYKYALLKLFCLETGDDPDQVANSVYEPAKCLEFDLEILNHINSRELPDLNKFLEETAASINKHPEDIKREAMKRLPSFVNAYISWQSKKSK